MKPVGTVRRGFPNPTPSQLCSTGVDPGRSHAQGQAMKAYYSKLHAPRADFAQTMTPREIKLMQEHGAYLRGYANRGWAVAFGPVADSQGHFGVGLWETPDEVDVAAILAEDPVIKSGTGFRYELHPMPGLVTRG